MGRHPLTSTSDPKHWLDRAEEMRAIADSLDLVRSVGGQMRALAEDYETLARRAVERMRPVTTK